MDVPTPHLTYISNPLNGSHKDVVELALEPIGDDRRKVAIFSVQVLRCNYVYGYV